MIPATRMGLPSASGNFKARRLSPIPVQATVDAIGTASFTFPAVPADETWTGSIRIPGVTPSTVLPVLWSATDGGVPIGEWWNSQSSGPLQARTQIAIAGVGITPGQILTAYLQGIATDIGHAPAWWPGPTPAPPPSAPQIVTQVSGSFLVGTGTLTIGTAPVVVGTSADISVFVSGSARVTFTWTAPPSLTVLESFPFDVRGGNQISGLVLPNVGPSLTVTAIAAVAGTTVTVQVFTGLPPITQSPVIPNGQLWASSAVIGAGLQSMIPLLPYYGPVSFSMSPNNTTGFGVYVQPADYAGNLQSQIRSAQGWPAGTGPFFAQGIIYLPAMNNTLVIDNSAVGSSTSYTTTGVTLGP